MGLADIRSVTVMTNRSPLTTATVPLTPGNGSQIVRKKRTFDIAFLTGQDTESRDETQSTTKSVTTTASVSSTLSSALLSTTSASKRLSSSMTTVDLITPIPLDESTSNSTGSSIDVMTNGSLSESEMNLSPCHRRNVRGQTPSPTPTPTPIKRGVITSSVSSSPSSSSPPAVLVHRHQHHPRDRDRDRGLNSKSLIRTKNNNNNLRGEEIRFESKRTIDINQTSDSVKIKENLQFSSTLPTSIAAAVAAAATAVVPSDRHGSNGNSHGHNGHGIHSHSSIPFALLPQIAKFPHLPSPFPGSQSKMEKTESINIISYPTALNTSKMNRLHSQSNQNQTPQSFPDPYTHLNIQIGPGGYPYPQNLMLPHDLNRSHNYHTHTPISSASQHHHHHHQQHQHHHHSSPNVNERNQISVVTAAAAAAAAATLLPPSLTALTLPAQNICAKCNIGFRMTSDLVYHMRSHHKRDNDPLKKKREEKLKCPVCHESFRERHHLTRHMTAHQDRAEEVDEKLLSHA